MFPHPTPSDGGESSTDSKSCSEKSCILLYMAYGTPVFPMSVPDLVT